MSRTIEEIREALTLILNKLETIESKLDRQEEDIKTYMERSEISLDSNELIIAGLRSTKTSFELLRDEVDEINELVIMLFKEHKEE